MEDRFKSSQSSLALLPRRDLQVPVFVPAERLQALERAGLSPGQKSPHIHAAKGWQNMRLIGLEATYYSVLPLKALGQNYFLVIRSSYPL